MILIVPSYSWHLGSVTKLQKAVDLLIFDEENAYLRLSVCACARDLLKGAMYLRLRTG